MPIKFSTYDVRTGLSATSPLAIQREHAEIHGLKVLDKDIIIISGEDYYESDYVPEEYAELNENIECISIMNASYLPQLETPEKVLDIINEYWK